MNVIVDELSMAIPVAAVDGDGVGAGSQRSTLAQEIAHARCWPSWDYGAPPVSAAT